MKKHAITAAAVTVLATGTPMANAQSTVQIYGILDASVAYSKGEQSKSALRTGDLMAPRLGFKGTEVVSPSLKVNFALEGTVAHDTGIGGATNTNNQASGAVPAGGFTFNRQSWVGVESTWGELRLGRNFNPTYRQYVTYDPFMGGGIGASQAAVSSLATYEHSPAGLRHSNAIEYWLPIKQALTGQFMYAMGENASGAANSSDGNYMGGRLAYQLGDWNLGIAAGKMRNTAKQDIKELVLGGRYRLGNGTISAMYTRSETGVGMEQSGWLLGTTWRVQQMEYRASFSTSQTDNAASQSVGRSQKLAAVAAYHLSKRSSVYVAGAYVRNKDGARSAPLGALTAAEVGTNHSAKTLAVGMTHTF